MGKETFRLTEKEALSIYARMLHTLDSSEFESFLSEDFSYSSQEVLTDMNSKDEFIAYIRPKLETIKQSKNPVYAELGICPAYGHTDCLIMAQGDKANLLGVAYASVDEGKICSLALCVVPTPDSADRSGNYPGLIEIDPGINEQDRIRSLIAKKFLRRFLIICFYIFLIALLFIGLPLLVPLIVIPFYYLKKYGYWDNIERIIYAAFIPFVFLNLLILKLFSDDQYSLWGLFISVIISSITFIFSKKIGMFYESIWDLNFNDLKFLFKKSTINALLLPKNKFGRLIINVGYILAWLLISNFIHFDYYDNYDASPSYYLLLSVPIFFVTRYLWFEESRDRIFYGVFEKIKLNLKKFNSEIFNTTSNADKLKKYAELRDQGVITEEEFQAKKKNLLDL